MGDVPSGFIGIVDSSHRTNALNVVVLFCVQVTRMNVSFQHPLQQELGDSIQRTT